MPGLNQLKQFSSDVEKLGNERKIRSERGDPANQIPLPAGLEIEDDSDEFIHGLPGTTDAEIYENANDGPDESAEFNIADDIPGSVSEPDSVSEMSDSEVDDLMRELGIGGDEEGNPPDIDSFLNDGDSFDTAVAQDTETDLPPADQNDFNIPEISLAEEQPVELSSEQDIAENVGNVSTSDVNPPVLDKDNNGSFDNSEAETFDLPDIDDALASLDLPSEPEREDSSIGDDTDGVPSDAVTTALPIDTAEEENSAPDSLQEIPVDTVEELPEEESGLSDSIAPVMDMSLPDFESDSVGDSDIAGDINISAPNDTEPIDFESADVYEIPDSLVPSGVHRDRNSSVDSGDFDADDALSSLALGDEDEDDSLDDSFSIPGFSDINTSSGKEASLATERVNRQKFELTDTEYEKFKKNLATYPLNLRIALEDMVVKNEFKDAAVYEVLQKVVKRVSTRHLAGHLEKMLDTTIAIPRDFERRTAAQYEEYKKSFEYRLKNQLIPFALLGICGVFVCFLLFLFAKNLVYFPLRAELLYKQGYTLLEQELYPQSEIKFNEAVSFKPKKGWFFKYARGYREHKQYDRARGIYKALLGYFNHDLKAGLEYADMEASELSNYEEAVNILKREVLDYHINDKDGLLMLGDVYLEWATNLDPAKFEDARLTYATLMQLYGTKDLYLARMMRYFIRIDDLNNVLSLKNYFYPKKKSLDGQDLIELSGYLLDKLYGTLPLSEEYLRSSIEDVRSLLERAVEAAPEVPESTYNLARYFMYTGNRSAAESGFETAVKVFEVQKGMKSPRLLRYINSFRYLGELYAFDKEYIRAQEFYAKGIDLYEKAVQTDGLQPTEDIGILYADMADVYYFESGDMSEALRNYMLSVENKNDTPSIRYRIGYISYNNEEYDNALVSFINAVEKNPLDTHVLLALGNTLAKKGDNFAALGYYRRLVAFLDKERTRHEILFPQVREDQYELVDMYCKATNNSGVVLYRLAKQTGQSTYIAEAQVNLSDSIRAYDALTRNMDTFMRIEGSNLAAENSKYMSQLMPQFDPEIYTDIPMILSDESMPE